MAPQQARTGVNSLTTRTGAEPERSEIIFGFISVFILLIVWLMFIVH